MTDADLHTDPGREHLELAPHNKELTIRRMATLAGQLDDAHGSTPNDGQPSFTDVWGEITAADTEAAWRVTLERAYSIYGMVVPKGIQFRNSQLFNLDLEDAKDPELAEPFRECMQTWFRSYALTRETADRADKYLSDYETNGLQMGANGLKRVAFLRSKATISGPYGKVTFGEIFGANREIAAQHAEQLEALAGLYQQRGAAFDAAQTLKYAAAAGFLVPSRLANPDRQTQLRGIRREMVEAVLGQDFQRARTLFDGIMLEYPETVSDVAFDELGIKRNELVEARDAALQQARDVRDEVRADRRARATEYADPERENAAYEPWLDAHAERFAGRTYALLKPDATVAQYISFTKRATGSTGREGIGARRRERSRVAEHVATAPILKVLYERGLLQPVDSKDEARSRESLDLELGALLDTEAYKIYRENIAAARSRGYADDEVTIEIITRAPRVRSRTYL